MKKAVNAAITNVVCLENTWIAEKRAPGLLKSLVNYHSGGIMLTEPRSFMYRNIAGVNCSGSLCDYTKNILSCTNKELSMIHSVIRLLMFSGMICGVSNDA